MTALLEKLKPKISQPEIKPPESPFPSDPCPSCGCPYLWQDIYGGSAGPWRCVLCDPAPHDSFIARWHRATPAGQQDSETEEDQFGRKWKTYDLTDDSGQQWTVTLRRDASQCCPNSRTLCDWI